MSTHSNIPESRRRGIGLTALSMLSGLLLALQFVLPPAAFASSSGRLATPAFSQQGVLDLAGVSVVRLVISYSLPPNHTTRKQCTVLGTLVGSWKQTSPTDQNNWVLTDGSLVNLTKPCQVTNGQLVEIQILANNAYTGTHSNLDLIDTIACRVQNQTASCADNAVPETVPLASNAGALFSFHTDASHLQPFLQVVGQSEAQAGIELATSSSSSATWPSKTALTGSDNPQMYLTPKLVDNTPGSTTTGTSTPGSSSSNLNASNEPGMPFFNSDGALVGMNLTSNSLLTGQAIQTLLKQQPELQASAQHANPLNDGWNQGIRQYEAGQAGEAGQYAQAQATLHQIDALNPQFQAPLTFEQLAAMEIHSGANGTGTGSNPSSKQGSEALNFSTILVIIGLVAGVLLLILLLVMVSLRTRRRHELARFEAERAEAQRIAERQVQQMQRSKATANLQQPVAEMSCPNCGVPVHVTDSYCPKCRYLLSPSDSGLHLHAAPPPSPALQTQPPVNYPAPASSISDLPTVEFTSVDGEAENERTIPYSIQQLQGRNLSLAVGYLTDPGIKRKHKPNEDSLFAIQGAKTYDSQPQQFGLFVVADGMGGHASGQDASRLAIQTIIDYMLPRISTSNGMNDEAFLGLLRDGVQHANQAVHQRNMEERADMGTTMTAALVVGATAYVANVGDSRTYLYREPEGLVKITHDHSVVASLVDAGIIKPDDIYTHPKRNQIYRSLGEKPVVDVDAFRVPLQPGDKLLLCSDGLWDMVRDPDIQRLMSAPAPDPSKTGRDLIQAALEGGGEDNVSVIVVSVTEATSRDGTTGVQLLTKPDTVTVPNLQLM